MRENVVEEACCYVLCYLEGFVGCVSMCQALRPFSPLWPVALKTPSGEDH